MTDSEFTLDADAKQVVEASYADLLTTLYDLTEERLQKIFSEE